MRRSVPFAVFAALVLAVLLGLGTWQVQRLHWKEGVLAHIAARIAAPPAPLPELPDEARDEYLAVTVRGALGGQEIPVLIAHPDYGPGFRIVARLVSGDRALLVDLGYVREDARDIPRMAESVTITGNLLWPDDADSWTPPPDAATGMWFAREAQAMGQALDAEPFVIVARTVAPSVGTLPMPVDTEGIPNDHLGYAITWFGLAIAWAIMAFVALRRMRRRRG
ncbi:MAG: SURF1 family protein [Rubellimicrobium sp.]|nr:SURF1 family protein [Rubellimicrobium sp.]